jgi:putative ABC transport system permease protein
MKIPLSYNFRNLWTRRLTTTLTIGGVALVVFVFTAVLMLANGLRTTLVSTGSNGNVILIRKSAQDEMMSAVSRESADIVKTEPEVSMSGDGKPVASPEIVVIINLRKKQSNDMGNVTVRGVSPEAMVLRPQIHLKEGRMLQFGSRDVIVGNAVADRFQGTAIGQTLRFGGTDWTIVGTFDAGKTGFASEVWGDAEQLMQAFNRPVFSSMTIRLKSPDDYDALKARLEADQRLQQLEVRREKDYYEAQSKFMATFIRALGLVITIIFSFGAIIGAMITMYAAVANRTVEIGTLRALGFQRRSVLAAFLIESLMLSFIGGIVGIGLASLLQLITVSTTNFGTFSELAFGFSLSPGIAGWSIMFSLIMGFIGGFLPAFQAAKSNIINALRAT